MRGKRHGHGRAIRDNVEAWLTRVIQTTARDMVRDEREVPGEIDDAVDSHKLVRLLGSGRWSPSLGTRVASEQVLREVLGLVPERERRLITMKHLQGHTAREIAVALGYPSANAADQAVSRARRALAAALSERPDLLEALSRPQMSTANMRLRRINRGPSRSETSAARTIKPLTDS